MLELLRVGAEAAVQAVEALKETNEQLRTQVMLLHESN